MRKTVNRKAQAILLGAGYLIVHDIREGSHTLEGVFEEGRANGVMRVSKAGKNNAIRTYRKGTDVGKAANEQDVISPFDGPLSAWLRG